ncbi:MAG TPA: carboxy terminal-processing peptidase [Polyangiales bacterium]|nr:carboxy terminal-processing peptidase [Polyangiales bacterium]
MSLVGFGFFSLLAALNCAGHTALAAPAGSTEAAITRLTTDLLEQSQFSHHALDRELAGKFLDSYLEALDARRSFFLQTDVTEFDAYRATLAQVTDKGDTTAARAIYRRYLERLKQRSTFVATTLKSAKFDFGGKDEFVLDREKAERPKDMAAAQELWRQQLRAEYLQEKLGGSAPTQIVTKLTRRYAQQFEIMKGLSDNEVLEMYLNALAHVYDPHSDYLGHEQMESLSISMNLSLFGIGAALENADGYCTVREVLPGGPAARSGALRPGDRIIAVAQGSKDPVDVVNMPLSRTVGLIRGPKGSTVRLSVLVAGAAEGSPPKILTLVREKIQLADQEAKARIIDLPRAGGATLRLGVVDVPEFYADIGGHDEAEKRSVTEDVARLLIKLKAEGVQGILLDLRRNGGGSLKEAISLTGLFIKKGPVVQTRAATGDVRVESDQDRSVAYDGPLVVLTSRFSASASEILAGALQDYGRAVIVGDSQTFGKGTVQNILPLDRIMTQAGLAYSYDPGALKITISKFYRPGGASTQLRGVAADIVLPSTSDISDVSESALKDPLPWDSVPPTPYERLERVKPYLGALRDKSAKRVASDKGFALLTEDIARLKTSLDSKSISLNEATRRKELDEGKARRKEREQQLEAFRAAQPKSYEITLKNAGTAGLPSAATGVDKPDPEKDKDKDKPQGDTNDAPVLQEFAQNTILNEGVQVLADYTEALRGVKGPLAATPTPPPPR